MDPINIIDVPGPKTKDEKELTKYIDNTFSSMDKEGTLPQQLIADIQRYDTENSSKYIMHRFIGNKKYSDLGFKTEEEANNDPGKTIVKYAQKNLSLGSLAVYRGVLEKGGSKDLAKAMALDFVKGSWDYPLDRGPMKSAALKTMINNQIQYDVKSPDRVYADMSTGAEYLVGKYGKDPNLAQFIPFDGDPNKYKFNTDLTKEASISAWDSLTGRASRDLFTGNFIEAIPGVGPRESRAKIMHYNEQSASQGKTWGGIAADTFFMVAAAGETWGLNNIFLGKSKSAKTNKTLATIIPAAISLGRDTMQDFNESRYGMNERYFDKISKNVRTSNEADASKFGATVAERAVAYGVGFGLGSMIESKFQAGHFAKYGKDKTAYAVNLWKPLVKYVATDTATDMAFEIFLTNGITKLFGEDALTESQVLSYGLNKEDFKEGYGAISKFGYMYAQRIFGRMSGGLINSTFTKNTDDMRYKNLLGGQEWVNKKISEEGDSYNKNRLRAYKYLNKAFGTSLDEADKFYREHSADSKSRHDTLEDAIMDRNDQISRQVFGQYYLSIEATKNYISDGMARMFAGVKPATEYMNVGDKTYKAFLQMRSVEPVAITKNVDAMDLGKQVASEVIKEMKTNTEPAEQILKKHMAKFEGMHSFADDKVKQQFYAAFQTRLMKDFDSMPETGAVVRYIQSDTPGSEETTAKNKWDRASDLLKTFQDYMRQGKVSDVIIKSSDAFSYRGDLHKAILDQRATDNREVKDTIIGSKAFAVIDPEQHKFRMKLAKSEEKELNADAWKEDFDKNILSLTRDINRGPSPLDIIGGKGIFSIAKDLTESGAFKMQEGADFLESYLSMKDNVTVKAGELIDRLQSENLSYIKSAGLNDVEVANRIIMNDHKLRSLYAIFPDHINKLVEYDNTIAGMDDAQKRTYGNAIKNSSLIKMIGEKRTQGMSSELLTKEYLKTLLETTENGLQNRRKIASMFKNGQSIDMNIRDLMNMLGATTEDIDPIYGIRSIAHSTGFQNTVLLDVMIDGKAKSKEGMAVDDLFARVLIDGKVHFKDDIGKYSNMQLNTIKEILTSAYIKEKSINYMVKTNKYDEDYSGTEVSKLLDKLGVKVSVDLDPGSGKPIKYNFDFASVPNDVFKKKLSVNSGEFMNALLSNFNRALPNPEVEGYETLSSKQLTYNGDDNKKKRMNYDELKTDFTQKALDNNIDFNDAIDIIVKAHSSVESQEAGIEMVGRLIELVDPKFGIRNKSKINEIAKTLFSAQSRINSTSYEINDDMYEAIKSNNGKTSITMFDRRGKLLVASVYTEEQDETNPFLNMSEKALFDKGWLQLYPSGNSVTRHFVKFGSMENKNDFYEYVYPLFRERYQEHIVSGEAKKKFETLFKTDGSKGSFEFEGDNIYKNMARLNQAILGIYKEEIGKIKSGHVAGTVKSDMPFDKRPQFVKDDFFNNLNAVYSDVITLMKQSFNVFSFDSVIDPDKKTYFHRVLKAAVMDNENLKDYVSKAKQNAEKIKDANVRAKTIGYLDEAETYARKFLKLKQLRDKNFKEIEDESLRKEKQLSHIPLKNVINNYLKSYIEMLGSSGDKKNNLSMLIDGMKDLGDVTSMMKQLQGIQDQGQFLEKFIAGIEEIKNNEIGSYVNKLEKNISLTASEMQVPGSGELIESGENEPKVLRPENSAALREFYEDLEDEYKKIDAAITWFDKNKENEIDVARMTMQHISLGKKFVIDPSAKRVAINKIMSHPDFNNPSLKKLLGSDPVIIITKFSEIGLKPGFNGGIFVDKETARRIDGSGLAGSSKIGLITADEIMKIQKDASLGYETTLKRIQDSYSYATADDRDLFGGRFIVLDSETIKGIGPDLYKTLSDQNKTDIIQYTEDTRFKKGNKNYNKTNEALILRDIEDNKGLVNDLVKSIFIHEYQSVTARKTRNNMQGAIMNAVTRQAYNMKVLKNATSIFEKMRKEDTASIVGSSNTLEYYRELMEDMSTSFQKKEKTIGLYVGSMPLTHIEKDGYVSTIKNKAGERYENGKGLFVTATDINGNTAIARDFNGNEYTNFGTNYSHQIVLGDEPLTQIACKYLNEVNDAVVSDIIDKHVSAKKGEEYYTGEEVDIILDYVSKQKDSIVDKVMVNGQATYFMMDQRSPTLKYGATVPAMVVGIKHGSTKVSAGTFYYDHKDGDNDGDQISFVPVNLRQQADQYFANNADKFVSTDKEAVVMSFYQSLADQAISMYRINNMYNFGEFLKEDLTESTKDYSMAVGSVYKAVNEVSRITQNILFLNRKDIGNEIQKVLYEGDNKSIKLAQNLQMSAGDTFERPYLPSPGNIDINLNRMVLHEEFDMGDNYGKFKGSFHEQYCTGQQFKAGDGKNRMIIGLQDSDNHNYIALVSTGDNAIGYRVESLIRNDENNSLHVAVHEAEMKLDGAIGRDKSVIKNYKKFFESEYKSSGNRIINSEKLRLSNIQMVVGMLNGIGVDAMKQQTLYKIFELADITKLSGLVSRIYAAQSVRISDIDEAARCKSAIMKGSSDTFVQRFQQDEYSNKVIEHIADKIRGDKNEREAYDAICKFGTSKKSNTAEDMMKAYNLYHAYKEVLVRMFGKDMDNDNIKYMNPVFVEGLVKIRAIDNLNSKLTDNEMMEELGISPTNKGLFFPKDPKDPDKYIAIPLARNDNEKATPYIYLAHELHDKLLDVFNIFGIGRINQRAALLAASSEMTRLNAETAGFQKKDDFIAAVYKRLTLATGRKAVINMDDIENLMNDSGVFIKESPMVLNSIDRELFNEAMIAVASKGSYTDKQAIDEAVRKIAGIRYRNSDTAGGIVLTDREGNPLTNYDFFQKINSVVNKADNDKYFSYSRSMVFANADSRIKAMSLLTDALVAELNPSSKKSFYLLADGINPMLINRMIQLSGGNGKLWIGEPELLKDYEFSKNSIQLRLDKSIDPDLSLKGCNY